MTTPSTDSREAALRHDLAAAAELLVKHGLGDFAARSRTLLDSPSAFPAIVVTGEINRGKSALINALIGVTLSPDSQDFSTSVPLKFTRPRVDLPAGNALLIFPDRPARLVGGEELINWATTTGSEVSDPDRIDVPVAVEVAVDSDLTHRTDIVDTPGHGALARNDAVSLRRTVGDAGILIFVCDSAAPISKPELEYLQVASRDIESVILVMSKIDTNMRFWRTIATENERLIRTQAPGISSLSVLGVSSVHARHAHLMPPGPRQDAVLSASGIATLYQRLDNLIADTKNTPTRRAVRVTRAGLEELASRMTAERASVENVESAERFETLKKQLMALEGAQKSGTWREKIQRDFRLLQRDLNREVDKGLDELKEKWLRRTDETTFQFLKRSSQLFVGEITADFENVLTTVSTEFTAGLKRIGTDRKIEGTEQYAEIGRLTIPEKDLRFTEGLVDPQTIMIGGGMITTAAVSASAAAFVALPVSGIALGAVMAYKRIKQGRKAHMDWINSTSLTLRKQIALEIDESIDTGRSAMTETYRKLLISQTARVRRELKAIEDARAATAAERAETIAQLDQTIEHVKGRIRALDGYLVREGDGRAGPC
ncbi:MAG: dynamin family protein [Nocardiaceae bacterium]|nr:dynamin family protein [Nocardiaceae bacterium]